MEHKLRVIRLRFIIVKSFEKIKNFSLLPKTFSARFSPRGARLTNNKHRCYHFMKGLSNASFYFVDQSIKKGYQY